MNEYRTAKNSDERNTALRSLGRSRVPECIKQTLELALSTEVKEQDIYLPIGGLRSHVEGTHALWQWAQDNWATLEKKLPIGLPMLSTVVQVVTSTFASEAKVKEIQAFFETKETKGFNQGLAQSLDSVRAKASWLGRDRADVEGWLVEKGYLKK